MEDKHHKEINDKLDLIIQNQTEVKYLPFKPYASMLAWYKYAWENPRVAFWVAVFIVDGILDLNSKGIVTALLTSFLK